MARRDDIERTIYDSTEEALVEFEQAIRSGRLFNVYLDIDRGNTLLHTVVAEPIPTKDELNWFLAEDAEDYRRLDIGGTFRFPLIELIQSEDPRAVQVVEYATEGNTFRDAFLFVADGKEEQGLPRRKKRAA